MPPEEMLAYCILYYLWYCSAFLFATVAIAITTCNLFKSYRRRLCDRFLTNEIYKSVLGRRTFTVFIEYETCRRCYLPRHFCDKYEIKSYRYWQSAVDFIPARMSSLAIALVLARVKKLESELISLDGNLQTLLKNVKQVEERKEHIKRQLNNAKLQTTHLKIWRLP